MAKQNLLDRAIGWVAPSAGVKRLRQRAAIDIMTRGYDGANRDRLNMGWRTTNASAQAEVVAAGTLLRDRMRDLVRNNPYAANAIAVLVTHAVGAGIVPRSKDRKLNELFAQWLRQCDADGHLGFHGIVSLATREMLESGTGIIRRRRRRAGDGLAVPLQLQVLEVDHLDAAKNGDLTNGRRGVLGIEYDLLGKTTAYWMFPQHPGNTSLYSTTSMTSVPVPSDDVAFAFVKQRAGQPLGVPWGHAVISSLHTLAAYEEAELIRKRLEACMVGVVTGGDEEAGVGIVLGENEVPGIYNNDGEIVEKVEPGTIYHARGGRDIKFSQPAATAGYDAYKTSMLHTIAAGFHVPHALLTGRLDKVNYSSSKVGLETFKRTIDDLQWQVIIPMICQPLWDWFCEAAYFAGKSKSMKVPVEWSPPRFPSADEAKDVAARVAAMRSGLLNPMVAIAETGYTPDEVIAGYVEWHKMLDDKGLVFDSDPRRMSQAGQTQQDTGGEDADNAGASGNGEDIS
ncbi:phage portal protein [Neorhizobium sp. T7_12]|uniref:phage portal protein n=1 Tax=Neorhizobium sp. T7_12 TaxID=2093832 RepID=UPI000CF8D966|nr:phage portal protein [Neorhizobium sp. T7_12]